MKLAARMSLVQPSPTMAVSAKARALRSRGVDVVDFGVGEPDFDTPVHVRDAIIQALRDGVSKYTAAAGLPVLREAIASEKNRLHGTDLSKENVIVTAGGKMALYELAMAVLSKGDEVLLPAPYWVSFPEQVKLAGGEPVVVSLSDDLILRRSDLERAATPKSRMVIVNTPSNPSGAVIPKEDLLAIADFCRDRGLLLVFDECYEAFLYPPASHSSLLERFPEMGDSLAVVGSYSKTFAMTGHRLGFCIANQELVAAMGKLQSHSTSNPVACIQVGGLAALQMREESERAVAAMKEEYAARRSLALERLDAIPGLRIRPPDGAFYLFPDVRAFLGPEVETSLALSEKLIEEAHVATVPGSAFGMEGFLRISYATSRDQIEEGLSRIDQALRPLAR